MPTEEETCEVLSRMLRQEVDLKVNEENTDWNDDYLKYKKHIPYMLEQVDDLHASDIVKKIEIVHLDDIQPSQKLAYDVVVKHVKEQQKNAE